jgi:hypothetical protein
MYKKYTALLVNFFLAFGPPFAAPAFLFFPLLEAMDSMNVTSFKQTITLNYYPKRNKKLPLW